MIDASARDKSPTITKRTLRFFVSACLLGAVALVQTSAHAGPAFSPALYAVYPHYNLGSGDPMTGALCHHRLTSMPSLRQHEPCAFLPLKNPSVGVYEIRVQNGAPLPRNTGSSSDTGYAVFVTTVGSNAHCSETSTGWVGGMASDNMLISTVTCVTPAGANTNANFVWFYRTDSEDYPQDMVYTRDFFYTRVNRGAPTQPVGLQTFDPFLTTSPPVTSQKLSTGKYRVTFPDHNVESSFLQIEPTTGLNNVLVQKTCSNDTSAACKRAECSLTNWSVGYSWGTNATADVSCYDGSTLVDVDFRVYFGNQSHSSQANWHYAWANSPGFPSVECKGTDAFKHRNVHEDPWTYFPTLPLTACRTGTGKYTVPLENHAFYHRDAAAPVVSSRATGGVYCNVGTIDCGGPGCVVSPGDPSYVTINCYNSAGNAANALWNLSLRY